MEVVLESRVMSNAVNSLDLVIDLEEHAQLINWLSLSQRKEFVGSE